MRTAHNKTVLTKISCFTLALFVVQLLPFNIFITPAAAQTGGESVRKVAVFVLPATDADVKTALSLTRTLRDNVRGLAGVQLVTPAPVPNAELLPEVEQGIQEAYGLLNQKRVSEALAILTAVRPNMEAVLPLVPVRTVALFYKAYGAAMALSNNPAEAKKAIEVSLLLYKDQTPVEYAYSAEVIKLFMEVQNGMEGRGSVRVNVNVNPENALVTLDSREPGWAPASFTTVPVGPHMLKVAMDGYEQQAGFYSAKRGEENTWEVQLRPIPEKATFDERMVAAANAVKASTPEAAGPALLSLKDFLGVDELLIFQAALVGEQHELTGYHVRGPGQVLYVKRALKRDASFLTGIREFLSGSLESVYVASSQTEGLGGPPIDPAVLEKAGLSDQNSQLFDPDKVVFAKLDREQEESIVDQWWFWTGVGILVAGAIGGVVVLATSSSESKGPTGTIEIHLPQ